MSHLNDPFSIQTIEAYRGFDRAVGRIMEALTETGLDDRTVIVFASDHGDFVGEYGLIRKGSGISDFLMRVPLLFNGPTIPWATDCLCPSIA